MAKEQLGYISILYTIGAIFIVLFHSVNYIQPSWTVKYTHILGIMTMVIFLFFAGFLLSYTNGVERKGFKNYIWGKVQRLLIPYWFLSTVVYLIKWLVMGDSIGIYSYIEMLFVPRDNSLGHFWFIPLLFNMYLIYAVFIHISKDNTVKRKIINIGLLVIFLFLHIFVGNRMDSHIVFGIQDICYYGIVFALGYFLSDFILREKDRIFNYYTLSLFGILSVVACCLIIKYHIVFYYYVSIVLVTIFPFAFILSYLVRDQYNNRFFQFFDKKYFIIYLYHWIVEFGVIMIVDRVFHFVPIARVLVFACGLLVPVLLYNLVNKMGVKNNFLRLLLGM
ncbi:MAG: acyltransferase [Abditibacteriota bacterium]|nr:acyltransferase [Abditibacteriota bacterium]